MAWKLYQTSSKHASLENSRLEPDSIPEILDMLRKRFGDRLRIGPGFGFGLDSSAGDIFLNGVRLTVGWDIWSGLFIMAWDDRGDPLVREIAEIIIENQEERP